MSLNLVVHLQILMTFLGSSAVLVLFFGAVFRISPLDSGVFGDRFVEIHLAGNGGRQPFEFPPPNSVGTFAFAAPDELGDGGEGVRARLVGRRIFRRRKPKM